MIAQTLLNNLWMRNPKENASMNHTTPVRNECLGVKVASRMK
jgi:hypothetical protein